MRKPLTTDPKTGHGSLAFRVDDKEGGRYIVRVAGTDRFGNPIVADRPLTISGKKDETKLRLLADRQRYKVGEEASVNLHSRDRAGTALLTWEADRILTYKIVSLNEGNNPVAWLVDGPQFPNFTLTATRMARNELDQARLDVQVERDLKVEIAVAKPAVGPGDPVELDVTTVDQLGRPVAAELSIAVVDQSLLRLFGDPLPAIGAVLLRPDPHRRLRDRGDQHVSLRTRHDGRSLRPWSKSASASPPSCLTPSNRRGVVADLAKPQANLLRDGQRSRSGRGRADDAGALAKRGQVGWRGQR